MTSAIAFVERERHVRDRGIVGVSRARRLDELGAEDLQHLELALDRRRSRSRRSGPLLTMSSRTTPMRMPASGCAAAGSLSALTYGVFDANERGNAV